MFRQQDEEDDAGRDENGDAEDGGEVRERSDGKEIPKEGEEAFPANFIIFRRISRPHSAASAGEEKSQRERKNGNGCPDRSGRGCRRRDKFF